MGVKVDPMTMNDYHWASIRTYSRFIEHFTGLKLKTMGEFQLLLGIILGWQMITRYGPDRIKFLYSILDQKWNNKFKVSPSQLKNGKHDNADRGE